MELDHVEDEINEYQIPLPDFDEEEIDDPNYDPTAEPEPVVFEENPIFGLLTKTATAKCFDHCILYPDVVMTTTESQCLQKCTTRFMEALGVTVSAVDK